MLPTTDQFLAALAANPQDAIDFDRATKRERPHCKTRRDAVEATLSAVRSKIDEQAARLSRITATKARVVAVQHAKALTPAPTPAPVAAPIKLTTAAAFATPPLVMARAEFEKLTAADRSRFFAQKGKLV